MQTKNSMKRPFIIYLPGLSPDLILINLLQNLAVIVQYRVPNYLRRNI